VPHPRPIRRPRSSRPFECNESATLPRDRKPPEASRSRDKTDGCRALHLTAGVASKAASVEYIGRRVTAIPPPDFRARFATWPTPATVVAMRRALPHVLVGLMGISLVMMPRPAAARRDEGPLQITPEKQKGKERRQARRADVDRSEGGTRRGVLELTLGSIVGATSGLLVGRGVWEAIRAGRIEEECARGSDTIECTFVHPGRQARIAAGLSFGFAGVLGLASGFLLVRGVRIHRDWREWKAQSARLSLRPWASIRDPSGGLSLRLRF
jgi:hypothetical protein